MADPWDSDTAVEARPAWEADTPVDQPQPNMGAGNKSFARVVGDALVSINDKALKLMDVGASALKPSTQTIEDMSTVYAPLEAAANAGTGLLFGFPAYVGAGLSGITQKYLLGMDVDPKQLAESIQKIATYQPVTERGERLTGNLMLPLTKLQEGAEAAGHKVTDIATIAGASTNAAAGLGAITDASLQMLSPLLLGELHRKMGGQTVTSDDMANVAKVVALNEPKASSAAPAFAGGEVAIVKQSGMNLADVKQTEAATTPVADGFIRMYRAESPSTKFGDVFDADRLGEFASSQVGVRYTSDLKYADYFRNAYGADAKVSYIDVPKEVADRSLINGSEYEYRIQTGAPDPAAVERSLRGIYDKTGIGPFTIAAEAARDPTLRVELLDPNVEIPKAIEPYVEGFKAPEVPETTPLTDVMGEASKDFVEAKPEEIPAEQPAAGPGTLTSGVDPNLILREIKGTAKDIADAAKSVTNGIVDSGPGQELIKATFPMSAGVPEAQAVAQKFANAMRLARFQWQRIHEYVTEKFTPEERTKMYEAAEEQNLLLTEGKSATGKGIDRLTPDQRGVMNELHSLSDNLWKRAQDAGMVEGEGLKYWTPRMAVMIGEDGTISKPPSGAGAPAREGKNVKTTASSLKHRKHLTAEETEAAMKGALGDEAALVRDIAAMPVAMQRMSEAIAGRELVNQIKELGLATGEDIVSTDPHAPGFVTIDHPAFTTYKPEFVKGADGKVAVRMDTDGNPVMQRIPLRISKEWEGPIKAVLSSDDGLLYKMYMLLKSKAMTALMLFPTMHNMVIFGRAVAYDPVAVSTFKAYTEGHILAKDGVLMSQAIKDGMVPIGANKGSMLDITDVAGAIGKEGSWGDINQSWINLAARKMGNVLSAGLGDAMKTRMDAFGDWWHHTLLWKQVEALQMYVYNDYKQYLLAQGHPPEVAGPIAANLANRYGGAAAPENSSALARKALNVMLFSRSFNVGNVGAVHDAVMGMPAGLRAKMLADVGTEAGEKGLAAAKAKARMGLVADLGMSMLFTAAASAGIAKLLQDQSWDEIGSGYARRLQAMAANIGEHPLQAGSYNPYRILPTYENEPGKEERIDLGQQPGGAHEYVRLPTGKVVEDTVGWVSDPFNTAGKKLSPVMKGLLESIKNDKGFGVPVEDPEGGWLKHLAQGIQHVIESQVPMEQLKTLWDVMNGNGTKLDKDKLIGTATGFSVSRGNPHGPEGAVFQAQKDRIEQAKAYAMDEVKDDIKHGRDAEAYKRLSDIGLPPREIILTINAIKNPRQGMSRMQMRKFVQQANEEDQTAIENAGRQKETQ